MEYKSVRVITPPATEPVTVDECKLDARVDDSTEDSLFMSLIAAARQEVEQVARRALITRTLELSLDRFPAERFIVLPYPPLVSVLSIKYFDSAHTEQTISAADYLVMADEEPGRVVLASGAGWPGGLHEFARIRIRYTAGYGVTAASVPEYYKFDVRGLVKVAYEFRSGLTPDGERARERFLAHAASDWGW